MKKFIGVAVLLAMMAVNTAAFADSSFVDPASFTGGNSDSVGVADVEAYSIVLITKDDGGSGEIQDEDIVYIDQSSSGFNSSQEFLIKENPEVGKYKVRLRSSSTEKETYFYVGVDPELSTDVSMKRLQNEVENLDGTYNIGFYSEVTAAEYGGYNSMKLGYRDNGQTAYAGFSLTGDEDYPTQFTGEGSLFLIFQLNDVPLSNKDYVAVFLSEDNV